MRRRRAPLTGLLALAAVLPTAAAAQGPGWLAGAGVSYETYHFGDAQTAGVESLSLLTIPLAAQVQVGRVVSVGLDGNYARGSLTDAAGATSTLSGFTDSELTLSVPIVRGGTAVTFTGMAILPTGKSTQTAAEATVAGAMAAELLPFRITNWGSGGGAALAASVAQRFGEMGLGASVGYRATSEFEPLDGESFGYRPGNELRVRVAADRTIGESRKASLALTMFRYGNDRFDGQNLFQSGTRLQALASYAFPVGYGNSAVLYAGALHRSAGSVLTTFPGGSVDPNAPSQTLLLFGGGARAPSRLGVLVPSTDLRLFRREDGIGQGYLFGLGLGLELPLARAADGTPAVTLIPSLKGRLGNLMMAEDASTGVTGAELGLTLRFGGEAR
jgi:hypothetical protein